VKSLALVGDLMANEFPINSCKPDKITQSLTFSNVEAKHKLDWEPIDVLQNLEYYEISFYYYRYLIRISLIGLHCTTNVFHPCQKVEG
jgi:hypothetical protein